ncbi:MAG TPA: DUF5668 domain-containing protein [Anaerolineaceae bacterium]|nr:DUF5668 domain-containing protein [Anaerolineaceae bacterium]
METKNRVSIFWPLMLIIVGVILILVNTGVLEGDSLSVLIRLWPLLFVIGGLDAIFRGDGIGGAIILMTLGVVLLLGNFGYLGAGMGAFALLLRLWPVFLVAIGVDLIFRGSPGWVAFLGGLLAVALVAGVFFLASSGMIARPGEVVTINQPLAEAQEAEVIIDAPVADLWISTGEDADLLAEGTITLHRGQTFVDNFVAGADTVRYTVSSEGDVFFPVAISGEAYSWELRLNGEAVRSLDTSMGVGRQVIDLTGMQVEDFTTDLGVGQLILTLPDTGSFTGRIHNGIGATTIQVPRDASVEIRVDTGITGVSLPDGYVRDDDLITSPGTEPGQADILLVVDSGIGAVAVEYLP